MSYTQREMNDIAGGIEGMNTAFTAFMAKYRDEMTDVKAQTNAIEKELSRMSAGGFTTGGSAAPSSGFKNLGEFAQKVMLASKSGGVVDERLLKIQAAASGANEGIPSDGGFLVGTDMSDQLLQGVFETALVAKLCNRIPISTNANGIKLNAVDETSRVNGSRWGGVQSYWAAEAATVTATKPKFRQMELNLKKLFAICYATDELLQDSAALGRVLTQAFNEEIGFKVDDAILNGTGAGQPLGILNSGALVTVSKETGQRADTIVFENILKMYSRMLPRSRKNAVWLISQSCEPQLFSMSLAVGTGGVPVYLPASGAAGQPYPTLLGRPVLSVEQCATLGDLGDIMFVDPSAYVLIDKGGIQSAASLHLQFLCDEMTFRWIYRCDGQPMLASPITPFKGSNTLSPFVTLEART